MAQKPEARDERQECGERPIDGGRTFPAARRHGIDEMAGGNRHGDIQQRRDDTSGEQQAGGEGKAKPIAGDEAQYRQIDRGKHDLAEENSVPDEAHAPPTNGTRSR